MRSFGFLNLLEADIQFDLRIPESMDYPLVERLKQSHCPGILIGRKSLFGSKPRLSRSGDLRIVWLDISAVGLDEVTGGLGG